MKDNVWKTGFIVVQDEEGNVMIDRSMDHFQDRILRECNSMDCIYMLRTALKEFESEQLIEMLIARLQHGVQ